jgi:hypothetical protein
MGIMSSDRYRAEFRKYKRQIIKKRSNRALKQGAEEY